MQVTLEFIEKRGIEIPRTDNIFEIPNCRFVDRHILQFEEGDITKFATLYYVFENFVEALCFHDFQVFTNEQSAILSYEKIYKITGGIGECS